MTAVDRWSRVLPRASWLVTTALVALVVPAARGAHAQVPVTEYAARRAALAAKIDSGAVLVFGRREPVNHWPPFYQNPSFRYLTGFLESNAAFVLVKRGGAVTSNARFTMRSAR